MTRVSYTTIDPSGQHARTWRGCSTRLALTWVPRRNSVGPLQSVSSQSGMKTLNECGGKCALPSQDTILRREAA
eukprot:CAMPEP_0183345066 /NCGR_PEP_ID=MMETSP0164_2-20130417/10592_1 /TAXON_ID=221442 /ORGANISM="Coccolithus pelagicus ssp braarudi, Strain PLY182g" /LENGTH=73 /DNA_ID=CAMNT_0025516163 /DNA_START=473 /DNA_END=694 /DNA_ORIENTATION=+